MNKDNILKLEEALSRINNNSNVVYFFTYDTKNNPKASIKHIYDMCKTLNENGIVSKILVEDKTYTGVKSWLGDVYDTLEVVSIKDNKVSINVDDILVVPEFYSGALEQLNNLKCVKVMLVQHKDYIFESLPIGARWSDFGFERVITTSDVSKKYIQDLFPETLVYVIPPIISDNFKPSEKLQKPYIAIHCRDRVINKRIVSEFYLKFSQLRWISFRDMSQMTYENFSEALRECMVSVWVDDESTFGTFPLESMKSNVPVIGKIPNSSPDWIGENGLWADNLQEVIEFLGSFVLSWIDGGLISEELKGEMKNTLLPYSEEITKTNIVSIFNSFKLTRKESIELGIKNLKEKE